LNEDDRLQRSPDESGAKAGDLFVLCKVPDKSVGKVRLRCSRDARSAGHRLGFGGPGWRKADPDPVGP